MSALPQREPEAPAPCPGTQTLDGGSSAVDGAHPGRPSEPLAELCGESAPSAGVSAPSAASSSPGSPLSSRGRTIKWFWDSAEEGYRTYHMDEYDEEKNPGGVINLGTSENKLCFDLLSRRLTQSDMLRVEPALLQYPDWRGHLFLREEVARFLSYYCKSPKPLKAENVVVLNGCASLFSALATVLCEVGDAFLIPAPYYGAITQHVSLYGSVRLVCAYLDSQGTGPDTRPFQLTVEKLEETLLGAQAEGVRVRGLILIHPQNPLGDVYTPEELCEFLEFAKRHALHVMVDEVYMLSVFQPARGYRSVLSLERLPDPQRTHVMWATSKDFGMSGLRFGTLYTENQDVATAVASLCRYHGLSGLLQYQMARLLGDRDWINHVYLPENHARLQAAHSLVSAELGALGVPFLSRGAGFFIWVDLRKYLPEGTFEEEARLWRRFLDHKVLLSPGRAFACVEPGWFRVVFSDQAHRLRLGMQRFRRVLEGSPGAERSAWPSGPGAGWSAPATAACPGPLGAVEANPGPATCQDDARRSLDPVQTCLASLGGSS
ncbi:1-aminocyclopropane-1-carboxylate synthase-like protein 1 [Sorex araneus]|uniref:1-aminocyclopropane-1-carboxylate synthase-like protein 1 n=1 Tax=Sorex araneus TaxID=42254 RepID=UPI002433F09F|nr:1-aminocyclopropane-1-carboxylate synthase-like protein 1 [Sorex araneus]XP_054998248.1 1-aminocyclopropane-1-carboxylate synthase-like protein 1 [Sorex araneus]